MSAPESHAVGVLAHERIEPEDLPRTAFSKAVPPSPRCWAAMNSFGLEHGGFRRGRHDQPAAIRGGLVDVQLLAGVQDVSFAFAELSAPSRPILLPK